MLIGARLIDGLHVTEHVVGEPAEGPLPLVLSLHGRGGLPELPFSHSTRPCRVLVPRGPFALGDGFAWSSHYAREVSHAELSRELGESADRLRTVVESVSADREVTGAAIVLGYSQGGMTALALATRHPELFRAAVVGAAWLPAGLQPANAPGSSLQIRMAHGESDEIVPFDRARALALRMEAIGFDVELRSFVGVDHAGSPEMTALLGAWRDQAIARASGSAGHEIPELGRRAEGGGPTEPASWWKRVQKALWDL